MYASTQYLLCGLPLVNTKNIGGRNTFFHPDYVIESDDYPNAVRDAVTKLINKNIDPKFIRRQTLEVQQEHRNFFIEIINEILSENGIKTDFAPNWNKVFKHKMGEMKDNGLIQKEIDAMRKNKDAE